MAYPSQFVKITWLFVTGTSGEIAETGLQIAPVNHSHLATAVSADITDSDLDAWTLNLLDILQADEMRWANYSTLVAVRMSNHLTSGAQDGDAHVRTLVSPTTGDAANVHPQMSVVLSLWSGGITGVGNYGRMFLPHTQTDLVGSTPYGDPVDAGFNSAHGAALITGINSDLSSHSEPAVVTIMSSAAGASNKPVTSVRVGIVTDTQRRRYDNLNPSYSVSAV